MASISVVIPAYNSSAFIADTLQSVFTQTLRPVEIIVVDDASTDGTPDLVSCIAGSAPVDVRLVRCTSNHGGPPAPLNIGIALARGELIATLDHDDLMLPSKLELQWRLYDKCPDLGLIISQVQFGDSECSDDDEVSHARAIFQGLPRQATSDGFFRVAAVDAYNATLHACYALTCSNYLFPKAVWQSCGGFDEQFRFIADLGFLQAVTKHHDIGIVDLDLVRWTRSSRSLFVTSRREDIVSQWLRFQKKFDRRLLSTESRSLLRKGMRQHYLRVAFLARLEADPWHAFSGYAASIYYGGSSRQAVVGIATLFPDLAFRAVRRATRKVFRGLREPSKAAQEH